MRRIRLGNKYILMNAIFPVPILPPLILPEH
jgi:hypothetical protein